VNSACSRRAQCGELAPFAPRFAPFVVRLTRDAENKSKNKKKKAIRNKTKTRKRGSSPAMQFTITKNATLRSASGFTLIEIMIAVVVVAILTAIALPSYTDYMRRAKIAEATSSLSDLRLRAEKFFADNRTYQNAAANDVGFNETITGARYFSYNCTSGNAQTFTCTATGVAGQGMGGFSYTINESNVRASNHSAALNAAGWPDCATRWIDKKGDAC